MIMIEPEDMLEMIIDCREAAEEDIANCPELSMMALALWQLDYEVNQEIMWKLIPKAEAEMTPYQKELCLDKWERTPYAYEMLDLMVKGVASNEAEMSQAYWSIYRYSYSQTR